MNEKPSLFQVNETVNRNVDLIALQNNLLIFFYSLNYCMHKSICHMSHSYDKLRTKISVGFMSAIFTEPV